MEIKITLQNGLVISSNDNILIQKNDVEYIAHVNGFPVIITFIDRVKIEKAFKKIKGNYDN